MVFLLEVGIVKGGATNYIAPLRRGQFFGR
jgi:hypothetical protein